MNLYQLVYKSINKIGALAGLLLIFCSCEENITLNLPQYDSKLAVFCILQPDSLPKLFLNQSKSYFDYSDTVDALKFVKDAIVVITNENSIKDTLKLKSKKENTNRGYEDVFYYEGKQKIEAGKNYYLFISHGGRQVSSETKVPFAPEITSISHEDEENGYNFRLTVNVKDISGEVNYYHIRGKESDTIPGNPDRMKSIIYTNEIEYQSDEGHDGGNVPVTAWGSYDVMNPDDTSAIEGSVFRASKETGQYFFTLNQQQYSSDDPFSEPVVIQHNITGGLGIFGSLSKPTGFRYKIR